MKIGKLDHINIRTTQLDTMINWYTDVLGLKKGARPDFQFPGAWMYAGDDPIVHLIGISGEPGVGSESALKLEHFALSASGRTEFEAKLQSINAPYRCKEIAEINLVQVNIWDPDGNHIHVDFPLDE